MKTQKQGHKNPKSTNTQQKHIKHTILRVIFAVFIVMAIIGVGWWYYSNRALPNIAVGNIAVGSKTPELIRQAIQQQAPTLRITFDDNNKKTTIPVKDLGVTVDEEATLKKTMAARRTGNIWQNMRFWQQQTVPLVLVNDPGVLIEYIKQHFPSVFDDPKEPQLIFNDTTNQFELLPGSPGTGFDIKAFERSLPELAKQPRDFTLKLTTAPVDPLLDADKLAKVRDAANERIKQTVEFKLNGKSFYTVKPADIARWMHFEPDTTTGTANLKIDEAKIQQFITKEVSPKVATTPIDRKVIVDSKTGTETVIQQGRAGQQLQYVEELSKSIRDTLKDNKPFTNEVSVVNAPFKTVTITGTGKWIEIDLSEQRLTAYVDDVVVKSALISSGTARTPTQIGVSAIYSKRPVMTMTGTIAGEYYYVPNVKWVSFFNGGEAIHGTYWHNNFGYPMSHGCINMTEADAKFIYDFAPIGTKVVVHA